MNGSQKAVLEEVIKESFTMFTFPMVLSHRLNKRFDDYVTIGAPYEYAVYAIVNRAVQEEWADQLIYALISERPKNKKLLNLSMDLEISFRLYDNTPENSLDRTALEELVNSDPLIDPASFIEGMSKSIRCVCRINYANNQGKQKWGTGFLVGKDLLLSNYHVFEDVIADKNLAKNVVCKFDFEIGADGKTINSGTDIGLDENAPIVESSPYCEFDSVGTPSVDVDWPEKTYDYALVKLNNAVGDLPFGPNFLKENGGLPSEKRGWIQAPVQEQTLYNGGHMIIIQHPDKLPVKVALGFGKVKGTDKNQRRVRYNINTLPGSSGSPCFDQKFNWIALHNMGDPNRNPQYNQGIPAKRIVDDLRSKGISL